MTAPPYRALAVLALIAAMGTVARSVPLRAGRVALSVPPGPYLAQSRIPVRVEGLYAPFRLFVLGPGSIDGTTFLAPAVQRPTVTQLLAAGPGAVALSPLQIAPAPAPSQALLAVATYDDGIALHDPRTFALVGYASIGGPPADVTFTADGAIAAPDTDGDTLARIARNPWRLLSIPNVPEGNEILADRQTGSLFVSDRDAGGYGALTRVAPDGGITRVRTGMTAEGLALDARRQRVYVGNVNDASVAVVDARTMRVVSRLRSVPRTFGIALDTRADRLFVVSNASRTMGAGGEVAAIDLRTGRIATRSVRLDFPLGIAVDSARRRVYVTDEAADVVDVLDAHTLRPAHPPLHTCRTPWRPYADLASQRLFVPCARADRVDVFDLRTLRRLPGAPFATGGFPLAVAAWR